MGVNEFRRADPWPTPLFGLHFGSSVRLIRSWRTPARWRKGVLFDFAPLRGILWVREIWRRLAVPSGLSAVRPALARRSVFAANLP